MLKAILSISGKPGLYKLVSQAKNMLIVESVVTGKRTPAYAHDKVISLGDISEFLFIIFSWIIVYNVETLLVSDRYI